MASAPKCRTCGKVEWNHLCRGMTDGSSIPRSKDQVIYKSPNREARKVHSTEVHIESQKGEAVPEKKSKTDRKEYLRLKAKERRARERELKKASGLSSGQGSSA